MKTNEEDLKNILKGYIKALMPTGNVTDFRMAKTAIREDIEMMYLNCSPEDSKPMLDVLDKISFQSVLNTIADKEAEKLLLLNEDGSSTGTYVDRKAVHDKKNLLWHREVAAIVLRENGTFAIITRSTDKKSYPGAKGLICGHVEGNSSYHEAVVGECSEEVGTLFGQKDFIRLVDQKKNPREDNLAYVVAYAVPSKLKNGVFLYQEQEVDGVEWISLERLKQYIEMSKNPTFKNMVIFRDTEFYRGLCGSLEKLFSLDGWYDHLVSGNYEAIHKCLGIETPEDEKRCYEQSRQADKGTKKTTDPIKK